MGQSKFDKLELQLFYKEQDTIQRLVDACKADDKVLHKYSTSTRWKQYQNGTMRDVIVGYASERIQTLCSKQTKELVADLVRFARIGTNPTMQGIRLNFKYKNNAVYEVTYSIIYSNGTSVNSVKVPRGIVATETKLAYVLAIIFNTVDLPFRPLLCEYKNKCLQSEGNYLITNRQVFSAMPNVAVMLSDDVLPMFEPKKANWLGCKEMLVGCKFVKFHERRDTDGLLLEWSCSR